jgi:threonylcarbamoyladenosine tRNA methylthiotransferase MtaB
MVGFPGETEEEFEQSLNFVRMIAFSRVHVFAYSRRPGTVADKMPDQISNTVKNERSRRMINACRDSAVSYAETYIGKTVPVLLETEYPDKMVEGHTDTYLTVRVRTENKNGDVINVRITDTESDMLIGEQVS